LSNGFLQVSLQQSAQQELIFRMERDFTQYEVRPSWTRGGKYFLLLTWQKVWCKRGQRFSNIWLHTI